MEEVNISGLVMPHEWRIRITRNGDGQAEFTYEEEHADEAMIAKSVAAYSSVFADQGLKVEQVSPTRIRLSGTVSEMYAIDFVAVEFMAFSRFGKLTIGDLLSRLAQARGEADSLRLSIDRLSADAAAGPKAMPPDYGLHHKTIRAPDAWSRSDDINADVLEGSK